jgi:alkylation response protein AidB-like acyl-CoA dehydrogenase
MDFRLTEEELEIRKSVRRFVRRELIPRREEINASGQLPEDLLDQFIALGLLKGPFPEVYEGLDGTFTSLVMAVETLAQGPLVPCWMLLENYLLSYALLRYGSNFLRHAYLPGLISLKSIGALAFTEPDTGSDPAQLATRAERASGGWYLNGSKRFITFSGTCDHMILFAKTSKGVTAFLVEPKNSGFRVGKRENLLHEPAFDNGDLYLENYFAPEAHVIGKVGQGFDMLLEIEAVGKIVFCAFFSGMAKRALELAVNYASTRTHRTAPIGRKFQMTQWKLAEMAARVERMEAHLFWVSSRVDEGLSVTTDSAALKLAAANDIKEVVSHAMEIHGAYGLSKEYEISEIYQASVYAQSVMGSLDIQRVILARRLLEKIR